jgi:hypothetical protein
MFCLRRYSGLTRQSILLGMTDTRVTVALREAAMDGSQNGWAWKEINFSDWRQEVDDGLAAKYCITIEDSGVDDDYLKAHWEMKQSPYRFVAWFGKKYDLDPVSAHYWS